MELQYKCDSAYLLFHSERISRFIPTQHARNTLGAVRYHGMQTLGKGQSARGNIHNATTGNRFRRHKLKLGRRGSDVAQIIVRLLLGLRRRGGRSSGRHRVLPWTASSALLLRHGLFYPLTVRFVAKGDRCLGNCLLVLGIIPGGLLCRGGHPTLLLRQ